MQRYLIHLVIVSLILASSLIGFNWLINPYNIWNAPEISGFNAVKPQIGVNERIYKIVGLAKRSADTFILGTSRSDYGLNPKHPAMGKNGLNLAIQAQPYRETRMLFDSLLNNQKSANFFVIGLDFFASNALFPNPADFDVDNFSALRSWQLLSSASTLKDSVRTFANQKSAPDETWSENGQHLWSHAYMAYLASVGHRKLMIDSEDNFYVRHYLPEPFCAYSFLSRDGKSAPLNEIRAIMSRAYREHINIKLFISPAHARQWETLAVSGLWNQWEEWKKRLVVMNEEEALHAGQQPFPLWDFSGYNSISTETVPTSGDTSKMRWYFDSSHYWSVTGDLLLDRVVNFRAPDRVVPDDFGMLLSSANIDDRLARIRADRAEYRYSHPEDIAEIEAMPGEMAKYKNCSIAK